MLRPLPYLGLGWMLALSLAGCQRGGDAQAQAAAASTIRSSLVTDPSLPSASAALAADAQAQSSSSGSQDTRANSPAGTLTKDDEKNEMPKGGQANTHSTPSIEGGAKR